MFAESHRRIPLPALLLTVALCFLAPPRLHAQGETTSAIAGQVTDASSSSISRATVTIVSTDNGLKRSAKTDEAGRFSFPQLRLGATRLRWKRTRRRHWRSCSRERHSLTRSGQQPYVLRTGFGLFSDLLPGSVADTIGFNPPYVRNFQGGLLGTAGGSSIAPGVPGSAIDADIAANQSFSAGFGAGQLSCASPLSNSATCIPPVSMTAVPDGKLRAPYFMQWSFALEHQLGTTGSLRVQYVGTGAVNQAYQTQVNGYQTVCQGCFAPFPYLQPADPRFAAVTQLNTGANSHYNGLQITALKRLPHGLLLHGNYTWSRCMDTVSNGGFLPFSSTGIIAPLPGDLARQYGPCDYDVRQNLTGTYVYEIPALAHGHLSGLIANGWQVSGTLLFHSGLPFSVVNTPYSADGNGIVNGSGPQFASLVPGVPVYERQSIPGVTQPGTIQWLNPNAFVSSVDPSTGACAGGATVQNCQFGNLGRNALRGPNFVWSDFYVTKWFKISEGMKLRIEGQLFNVFNHPNFALPSVLNAGIPGKPATQTGFGAITGTTSPPTGLLGVGLGGDSTPRMVAFQARLEF